MQDEIRSAGAVGGVGGPANAGVAEPSLYGGVRATQASPPRVSGNARDDADATVSHLVMEVSVEKARREDMERRISQATGGGKYICCC